MNRSLLLVICDFLLLSLLALARFDKAEPQEEVPPPPPPIVDTAAADMVDVLRLSLEDEQEQREALARQIEEQAAALEEERQRTEALSQDRSRLEGEQERLERMRQQLEAERTRLAQEAQQARQQLEATRAQQSELSQNVAVAQERQRLLQEQLQQREEALNRAQQQMQQLQQERESVERDRAVLATRLESAQTAQQRLEGEVNVLRTERQAAEQHAQQLATNVGELAQATNTVRQEISQQIEESTPMSSNAIFDRFRKNRVPAGFNAREALMIGDHLVQYAAFTVLIQGSDGGVYGLFESSETPFRLPNLTDLRSVSGIMQVGDQRLTISSVSFLNADPRIVAVRVDPAAVEAAGLTPLKLEQNPTRFQEAVVIPASGDRYGEAPVRLSPREDGYLRIESSATSRLFGSFAPSRGDLVFSRNGNLIGFMVSNGRAVILRDARPVATMPIGNEFTRNTAEALRPVLEERVPTAGQ